MKIAALLQQLSERNVSLAIENDELVILGKKQALAPSLLAELRDTKPALIEFLKLNGPITANKPVADSLDSSQLLNLAPEYVDQIMAAVPGGAANVQDIYPLAPLQEGILFHHLMESKGDAYLLPYLMAFDTRERLDGFLAALQAVVDRHDILRTSMAWEGLPEPVQVVWRSAKLAIEEVVIDPKANDAAEQLSERYHPRHYRVDVRQAPLINGFTAYDPKEKRWLLLLLTHHLAIDHTTIDILLEEILMHQLGQAEQLPAPLPFRNFVAQARLGMKPEEHEAFFRGMLADVDEPTAPFGLLDVLGDGSRIQEARLTVATDLARRLREQSRTLGISAASLFHLAWATVLARTSGRDDVVFGTVLFGRMQGGEGAGRTLGMFINTLPLRVQLAQGGVLDQVREVQQRLASLLRHEHAPLSLAQRCSAVQAPAPLFSALLNYRHSQTDASADSIAWQGIEALSAGEERTNYPIVLSVDDLGEEFTLTAQTLPPAAPERLCAMTHTALENLIIALESAPGTAMDRIGVLPEAERRQVLYDWNATQADYPQDCCIHELFEAQVVRSPEADAVVWDGGRLSYAELNVKANQLAHHLRSLGVKPDDRVAICLERGFELVISLLAVLKAGGAYVPLDPAYPEDRLAYMLADSAPLALLTDSGLKVRLADRSAGARLIDLSSDAAQWAHQPSDNPDLAVVGLTPRHLAYVIYTSGSTGQPKGVMVPHAGVVNLVSWHNRQFKVSAADRATQLAGLAFDASAWETWPYLLAGACLHLVRPERLGQPEALWQQLADDRITVAFMPTPLAELMLAAPRPEQLALRCLLAGGDRLHGYPPAGLPFELVNNYGPTENSVVSTSCSVPAGGEGLPPIGKPIANTRVYLLDESLAPVPVGVTGELYVGGAGLARGYLNRPELTAERFIKDPFSSDPEARLYKTGDLGRWREDGSIEFLGRNDFQVKIRGFRIELGEIEARLAEHPAVRETAVLAREDGTGGKRLVAYYTGDAGLTVDSLRAHLAETLPEYMVPVAFVQLEALPLTPNGKLDRKALPAPEGDAYGAREYEAPHGETEQALAAIWAELLKVDQVGRHDNFFELGGHSLLAVTLIARMRQAGLNTDVQALFAAPTLAGLAALADNGSLAEQLVVPANRIPAGCTAITPDLLPLVALSQSDIDRITAAVPGGAANVQDIYPLAPLQEGILFHHLMESEGDAYLLPSLLAFDNAERLQEIVVALQAVIDRHDILRTAVAWEGLLEPVQIVWRQASLSVEEVILDPEAGDAAGQLAERYHPRHYRFDVRQAPLMRVYTAYDKANDRWLLLLLMHHLVSDHTALALLLEEARAHLQGQGDQLPEPLPFRNFVAQARLGMKPEEHEAFFRGMLADVDEPTAPFGLLDVLGDGSRIQEARLTVATDLARRLREQARTLGISAASLFHLAWAAVLARTSGRDDVVFGTLLFGRMQGGEGGERVLGMFINTLPLRVQLAPGSVLDQVREVQQRLASLLKHEHAPLSLAQRCSGVQAPAPLFSALLNYRHSQDDAPTDNAAAWQGIEVLLAGEERTNYPIGLDVDDLGEGFSLTAQTLPPVAPEQLCALMHTALDNLITALESAPDTAMHRIGVLPEAERRQVLCGWNATQADYPRDRCAHELFEAQALQTPDAEALVWDGGRLSYAELNVKTNQLAHHLRSLGVKPDDRVAICAERGPDMIIGLLAVLKAGGAYVPLDPAYPSERLAYMLTDSAPAVLLIQSGLAARFADCAPAVPRLLLDADPAPWTAQSGANLDPQALGLTPRHLAYVIYTSGSTGQPKGVMIEHRSLVNYALGAAEVFELTGADTVLQQNSLNFDLSVEEIFPALLSGATLAPSERLFGMDSESRPTFVHLTAAHWHTLVAEWERSPDKAREQLAGVRLLNVTGDALSPQKLQAWEALCPDKPTKLVNTYGPTEATVSCTAAYVKHNPEMASVTIGRPMANTRIYFLDAQGEPVPIGVAGEIHVAGDGVARGYLNRPELTAERFIQDPFSNDPEARLYKTGDLGRWREDGTIEFLGRNDFQVKVRGFRIELGEIEARLAEHPALRETAVLAREDGAGGKRLVAYYTGDAGLAVEDLRAHLAEALPEYMVPAAFVHLEALPLTANGKLDRKALPAPEGDAYAVRGYEAPQGETEQALAAIWAELLKVDQVGRHDNFFELGGHSLLAVTLIARMRQAGLNTDVRELFAAPTLAGLAALADNGSHAEQLVVPANRIPVGCTAITSDLLPLVSLAQADIDRITAAVPGGAANVQDIYPLAPLQEGILFHHLMDSDGDAYLEPYLMAFDTQERRDGFLASLQAVIDRHDILRTAVAWEGLPEPVQVVWRTAKLAIEEVILDPEANDAAEQLAERYDPRHYRLDVRVAPMMQVYTAYDKASDRWLLLLLSHHLALDHTALDILLEEIQMHQLGQADQLPAPVPFRNFVAQARLGISREEHEAFFRGMLADVDEPTAPFGLLDVLGDGSRIQEANQNVDTDLAHRLRKQARSLGISAASLFHLAWAAVVSRTSGRDDVVFGTVLFGRMQGGDEADRVLGLFINTLPLRVQLAQGSVLEQVRDVQLRLASLLRHEHAPLSLAQRCSGVQAPAPLFSALLNYRYSQDDAPADSAAAWQGIEVLSGEERSNYPIVLSVDDLGEGFLLSAQTLSPVAPERLCALMRTALDNLITALESAPDTAMRQIGVLPEAERRQVLYDWNATRASYPQDCCIHELFEDQVAARPDAPAVVYNGRTLSYDELNTRANRLAHYLLSLGVGPEARVALCLERSPELIVGLLAVLKAGGAYVPLDPAYPEERLAYMLADSAPLALLTDSGIKARLTERSGGTVLIDLFADAAQWAHQSDVNIDSTRLGVTSAHLAYVIYTSGSTGQPKGVMVPHAGVVNLVSWHNRQFKVSAADRATQLAGLAFDASAWETWPYLLAGACLHLIRPELLGQPEALWQQLADDRITVAFMPTPLAELMLATPRPEHLALRCLLAGGDRLHGHPPAGLPFELVNNYGPTENSVVSTSCPVPAGEEGLPPIGKPIANTRVYLLDESLAPVPVGVTGELYVGGAGLARGYLNQPELTAERFLADPFVNEAWARIYKTGDLGRWREDGSIEFLGRNDFQVKIRGFRIELGEIEARLAEHPAVRETAVLAREDGTGGKRLVAYYTGDAGLTVDSLRAHLAETLPEYMVPVAFVQLEALPLTPNGKLDRKALPAPEGDAYGAREYEAPQGETEQALAALWAELLKVDQVGRHDNFFELGGHSLLAVTLIARMRQAGLNTDVRALFTAPTLAGLAALADNGSHFEQLVIPANRIPVGCTAITPELLPLVALSQSDIDRITAAVPGGAANVQDIYPLAPLQEGILFHHLMESEGDAYLLPALMAFDTRERLDSFLTALQAAVARHDILRTAVAWEGLPEPVQVVWRAAELAIEEVVIDPEANDAAGQLAERYDPRHYRFDVRVAPLIGGFTAYDPKEKRWLLLLLSHHLVLDHTALDILFGEIQMLQLGQGDQLPAPLPFRNFVAEARFGISREEHEAFFRGMLADVDEPTAPFGLLDVQGDGSGIEEAKQDLDLDLARRLRDQARSLGISAASLFHLAWASVLSRTSGRDDVVFGTVLFGRMQGGEGVERVLGMFINTLPLRVQLAQGSVLEQVRDVQSRLASLLRHEHAPLSLAQRCSGVQAPAPLFSALLNYRHSQDDAPTDGAPEWQGIELLSGEERTNYPVVLSVDDLGEGFSLTAQTLPPVAPERLCAMMHTALENLITALESAPDTAMRQIGVLPEAERRQVLYDWNATRADYPQDRCVHELFEAQALQMPEADAVVWDGGRLSYAELNTRANQLAHHLRRLGVAAGDFIPVVMARSVDMLVAQLAVLKSGCAYVPIDPEFPADRQAFMIQDCQARQAIIAENSAAGQDWPGVQVLDLAQANEAIAACPSADLHLQRAADTPAYIMYTSGSTGVPKGVIVPHRAINRLVINNGYARIEPTDCIAHCSNPAFDASTFEIWGALLNGARILIIPQSAVLEPETFAHILTEQGATTLFLTTALFNQYAVILPTALARLKHLLFGGERSSPLIVKRFRDSQPQCHLIHVYGPTETTTFATSYSVEAIAEQAESIPIGRPIANTQLYILDDQLQPAPIGVAGEIYIGGPGVAQGYLDRPELTAERFIADPFVNEPGAQLYKTGDLGCWRADGNIEFLDRNDFQVKIRGFRIELGEIEARLAEYPGVRETAVLAREDGAGGKRLVAYYTGDAEVTVDSLRAHLAETLPEYMVPAAFVHLEALPLTPNGKLDRKALCAMDFMPHAYLDFVPPRSTDEAKIAAVWRRLFQVESISVTANFFEMGGHSLSAVQLLSLLKQEGIEISIALLFEKPTIELLAWAIHEDTRITEAKAIPLRKTGNQPPLFLFHEVTGEMLYGPSLVQHIDSDIPVYGLAGQPLNEVPYRTMQAMAARLVRMIRAVQPHGPYRLAGWSLGGTLAYEVAIQLIGEDETVEFVGLLDSYINYIDAKDILTDVDDTGLLLDFVLADDMPPAMADEIKSAASSMDFAELVSKCQALSLLPAHLTADEFQKFLHRWHNYKIANIQYCARKLPIPIYLYSTTENAEEYPLRNWDSVLPKQQIRLIPVTGSHQTMMEPPHIESLGAALSTSIREASAGELLDYSVDYDPLVALQSGSFASAPLFCVPGAGGSVSAFTDLTLALESSRPVYGLQPRGLDGEIVPHTTVSAAAKAYLRAIQSLYPEGPLHLMGHSFGGWVVFEMALQLTKSGRSVASLTLVDTDAPHEPDSIAREYTETEVLMKLVEIYEQSSGASLEIQAADLDGLDGDARLKLLHQRLIGVGLMPKQSRPEMLVGTFRTFGTALRTRYCPEHHYAGPLRLVLAQTGQPDPEAVSAKWRYWVNDLQYWQSEGNHMTVIKQPYVNGLVDWLELGKHK